MDGIICGGYAGVSAVQQHNLLAGQADPGAESGSGKRQDRGTDPDQPDRHGGDHAGSVLFGAGTG